jgi:TRAP-type C4-dicarboxylate transport system substrate-binding protein
MKLVRTLVAASLSAAVLTGCHPVLGATTRDGSSDAPVSLTAISYASVGKPAGDQLAHFAELANSLSQGSITIKFGPTPDSGRLDTSADAVTAVRSGQADLAVVSTRVFDTFGVVTFQALQAPYLITGQAHADAVLRDKVTEPMLSGLESLGIRGLGIAFNRLEYPGSYTSQAMLTLSDYQGAGLVVRPSRATELLAHALGANAVEKNGQDLEIARARGEVTGGWGGIDGPSLPITGERFTVNKPAFVSTNTFVVNNKVFTGLSDAQQQSLRNAAAQTRDWWATTHHFDPVASAAAYCAAGDGAIAVAGATEEARIEGAARVFTQELQLDAPVSDEIARIQQLGDALPSPAVPQPCQPETPTGTVPAIKPVGDQHRIDGTWRQRVDGDVLIRSGLYTQDDAANQVGTWTWVFSSGSYSSTDPRGNKCDGTYVLDQSEIYLRETSAGCDGVNLWRYAVDGGHLSFESNPRHPDKYVAALFHDGLTRVGDAT